MLNIRSTIQKGASHQVFCQDATYSIENDHFIIAGVFDGCSEVKDSHFASTLFTKILRYQVNNYFKKELAVSEYSSDSVLEITELEPILDLEAVSRIILRKFFLNLRTIKETLELDAFDLSTSSIFLFYSKIEDKGIIYAFGDGYIRINGTEKIIDHQNRPRYAINYWPEITSSENTVFNNFLNNYLQIWTFDGLINVTISTDGILSFKNTKFPEKSKQEAIDWLTVDETYKHKNIMLTSKFINLIDDHWRNSDDLGIVRIFKSDG